MDVTYVGPVTDNSGYAEAARNNIAALTSVGVTLNVIPLAFEKFKSDLGELGQLCQSLIGKNFAGKIQITHCTPNLFPNYARVGAYNIGYTVWETDRLPSDWVDACNRMNEIWVPCTHNVEAFKNSGVTVPVFCVPHAFNPEYQSGDKEKLPISNIEENDFVFYSIFQWTERKNPIGLLKAYLTEFKENENVVLILKTYLVDPTNAAEKEAIKGYIKEVKAALHLKTYPKVLLISSLLSAQQIKELHLLGDSFVSLHACEGFGVPLAEAMVSNSVVITTGYGGPADFIHHKQTGYSVPYVMGPVCGMPWDHYRGDQNWAVPDLSVAKQMMREVYNVGAKGRDSLGGLRVEAREKIQRSYSWSTIGNLMKDRLTTIEKSLQ